MKALVTGASGFIGSTLIEELNTLGFEVHALMRRTSSPANLEGVHFTRVEGDLGDESSLRRALQGMNYVFHLAGATSAPNRTAYLEYNAAGTARLAKAASEENPQLAKFVYVSSLAAAGPARSLTPRTEREQENPVSAYGESKLQGERELLKFKSKFPVSIIRPPMVYGPKDKGVFVAIQSVARNLMPILQGSTEGGHKYYSLIHVKDLCRGIVQAAVAPNEKAPTGEVFYLTEDGYHTYQDLLQIMADTLGNEPMKFKVPKFLLTFAAAGMTVAGKIAHKNFPFNWDKLKEVLPDYWICSNEKAKKNLSFNPEFDLARGMADTVDWYKRNHWL